MEQNKQETLSNLYALRAGLSIMSSIHDNARELENNIMYCSETIKQAEFSKTDISNDLSDAKENYLKSINVKKEELLSAQTEKNKLENLEKLKISKKATKMVCSIILFVAIIAFTAYSISASISNTGSDSSNAAASLGFIATIGLLCWMCFSISSFKKQKSNSTKVIAHKAQEVKEIENKIFTLENNKAKTFKNLDDNFANVVQATRQTKTSGKNLIDEIKRHLSTEIKKFNKVYGIVHKQFNLFLNERDWGNIDLIIYLYETGRALDLRDALMQVDMERRNERLINAIQTATKAVSYTIERGFGELNQTIENKMNLLNSSIRDLSYTISEQTSKLETKMGAMMDIASAQKALQEKLNTSSDELAKDISYMRELSHRTFYNI